MANWFVLERGKGKYIGVLSRVDPQLNIGQLKMHFSRLWATRGTNFSQRDDTSIHPHLLYFNLLNKILRNKYDCNKVKTLANGKSDWLLKLLENSVEFLVVYLFLKFLTNPVEKVTQVFVVIPVENFPGRKGISEKVFLFPIRMAPIEIFVLFVLRPLTPVAGFVAVLR